MRQIEMELTPRILYEILSKHFDEQYWWPVDETYHNKNKSDPRFEIIIGAILTQNTAWSNVEKALNNLKSENMLDSKKMSYLDLEVLKKMIRASGFFNQKAERLKNISQYLHKSYQDNLNDFFNRNTNQIRKELLSLNGIGPETADSILLYAGNKPIFVVDAYTKRICKRLPLTADISYAGIQKYFEKKLIRNYSKEDITRVYNELHALIVNLAKNYCKKKPVCEKCPLQKKCMYNTLL